MLQFFRNKSRRLRKPKTNTKQSGNRVMLIAPPFYRLYFEELSGVYKYPLALGYLSGAIRKETDWTVRAYNADLLPPPGMWKVSYLAGIGFSNYLRHLRDQSSSVWQEIRAHISAFNPTIVGISAQSQNFASACIVARLVKEFNEDIIVAIGGPHPSMVGSDVFNCQDIDISVRGEGEATIVELLHAIGDQKEIAGIEGISYRKGDLIVENPPRRYIGNLDSLSHPYETAHEVLIDYDKYPPWAFSSIFATRGCPYDCFFCGSRDIWSRKVRFRSPENVVGEIKGLQKMGLESIHFEDDTFGVTRKYIRDICNAIVRDCPGLKWSCEIHVKLVDDETIALMKNAGCERIHLGIESGSNEMLKKIRKNITIEEAFSACRIIVKHGIHLWTFFMVGFPEETEQTLNETLSAMKKVREIGSEFFPYSIFTPYPGTEAFEFCRDSGLIEDDWDCSLYNHQSPENCFCLNIPPARFRELAFEVERMVDRENALGLGVPSEDE